MSNKINTIIIGGGHAGVCVACCMVLSKKNIEYLIFEKSDCAFKAWIHDRWHNFKINTPHIYSLLPGQKPSMPADSLGHEIVEDIRGWQKVIENLKIKEKMKFNTLVTSVEKNSQDEDFPYKVETQSSSRVNDDKIIYLAKNVIIATGNYEVATLPPFVKDTPQNIKQIMAKQYTTSALEPGNIIVIGGGQTGVQIAENLIENTKDRKIYLCTSAVPGTFRTYRGEDVFFWMDRQGFLHLPKQALDQMPQAQADALRYGHVPLAGSDHPISPFSLHRKGVRLLGRAEGFSKQILNIKSDRIENIKTALSGYQQICDMFTIYAESEIARGKSLQPHDLPEPEWDNPEPELLNDNGPLSIDLDAENITNIIWATGYKPNFDFLHIESALLEFDQRSFRPTDLASSSNPGLFYIGFPWLASAQSTNLVRFEPDANYIVDHLLL